LLVGFDPSSCSRSNAPPEKTARTNLFFRNRCWLAFPRKKCARFLQIVQTRRVNPSRQSRSDEPTKHIHQKKEERAESPSRRFRACERSRERRRGWEPRTLPSRRFQVLLTLFSKFFASFPHGTCALSVFRPIFSFGRNLPPALPPPSPPFKRERKTDDGCFGLRSRTARLTKKTTRWIRGRAQRRANDEKKRNIRKELPPSKHPNLLHHQISS